MLGVTLYLSMWRRSKGYDPRGRRPGGVRRVVAYALVVTLVIGLIAAKKAQADSAEAAKGLSRDLMALSDVLGGGRELTINGETVHVAVAPTSASVKDTLDRFQKHCDENPSAFGKTWAALALGEVPANLNEDMAGSSLPPAAAAHTPKSMDNGTVKLGTFRSGNDDEGVVLCLVRSETGPSDVVVAFQEFSRTQDLGALGKMRYAYARRGENGSSVLTAWTDEHFSFKSLAPATEGGDAPGTDSVIVPRLPGSQRLLSAEVAGSSYSVRVYAVPGTVRQAIATYDGTMTARGFQPIHDDEHPGERGYLQGGLFITMAAEPAANGTTLSFAELGANDGPRADGAK
jgi:hypothetical protein